MFKWNWDMNNTENIPVFPAFESEDGNDSSSGLQNFVAVF